MTTHFNHMYPKGKVFDITFEVTEDSGSDTLLSVCAGDIALPGLKAVKLHFNDSDADSLRDRIRAVLDNQ